MSKGDYFIGFLPKKSADPGILVALVVLGIICALVVGVFAAFLVIPVAIGYGIYKLCKKEEPIPTYEPEPEENDEANFDIPDTAYREHGALIAPSGSGKTQFLQLLILSQLVKDDPPGMIVLDSTGAIMNVMERLELFHWDKLGKRILILDPQDERPPALNLFQMPDGITEAQKLELFTYIFSAIDRDLTPKQATAIPYVVKLLNVIPNSNLHTLRQIMDEPISKNGVQDSKYYHHIQKLDPLTQDFFANQFNDRAEFGQTRKQIASRLYTLLSVEAFDRMFAARENKFNAFEALQDHLIVIVNTAQAELGEAASQVFGRFVIAQCRAAAFARNKIHPSKRDLAILFVDEASEYFDRTTERILAQTRQFGLGIFLATQNLEQIPHEIRAAIMNNTAIKIAGPVAHTDAVQIAREMNTTPEFIRSTGKGSFAVYIRGQTKEAIRLRFPAFLMENLPTLSYEDHLLLREFNRRLVSDPLPTEVAPPPPTSAPVSEQPSDDPSRPVEKW